MSFSERLLILAILATSRNEKLADEPQPALFHDSATNNRRLLQVEKSITPGAKEADGTRPRIRAESPVSSRRPTPFPSVLAAVSAKPALANRRFP